MLFAQRFLTRTDPVTPTPGTYDEVLDLRLDHNGEPVALGIAALGPSVTKADLDPAPALGPTQTRGDLDPDKHATAAWAAGPFKTSADLDRGRPALP